MKQGRRSPGGLMRRPRHQAAARTASLTARPHSAAPLRQCAATSYGFPCQRPIAPAPVEAVPLQRMDPLTRGSCSTPFRRRSSRTLSAKPASDPVGGIDQGRCLDGPRRGRRVSRRIGASRRAGVGRRSARARTRPAALARLHQPGSQRLGAVAIRVRLRSSGRPRARPAERQSACAGGRTVPAARLDSVDGTRRPAGCASPITRPGKDRPRATRS